MGDDLTVFFKMIIPLTKFFERTIVECFLIIFYKLFPV